jgi:H/ACA ribonucleoprotein complex subunit 2
MAKEKPEKKDKKDRSEKKDKKERKRSETDGVTKPKKDKKEKHKDKLANGGHVATALLDTLAAQHQGGESKKLNGTGDVNVTERPPRPVGALVPFANPLADEKAGKKVLKSVKKGMCLKHYCARLRNESLADLPLNFSYHSCKAQGPQTRC